MACGDEELRKQLYIYMPYRKAIFLDSELTRPYGAVGPKQDRKYLSNQVGRTQGGPVPFLFDKIASKSTKAHPGPCCLLGLMVL